MNAVVEDIVQALDDLYKIDDSPIVCGLLDTIRRHLPEIDAAISLAYGTTAFISLYKIQLQPIIDNYEIEYSKRVNGELK